MVMLSRRAARGGLLAAKPDSGAGWDALCFFLISVGYKVPWTAISSLLHQLNQQFGQPRVLLWLNLAYFLPSIPALLLHGSLQDCMERRMGVHRAALARFTVGLGGLALLCLAFPSCSSSLTSLLALTAAVGVAYSVAFGTSHQLVPRFSQRCTVALTTGFVSCGVVVLLADLALKPHMTYYTPAALNRLFQVAAAQTLVGLLSAALLLRRHWRRLAAANKQLQHHVIGVLPASGLGVLGGRAGSGGSSGSNRLLPRPNSWTTGHVAGAVGFRHVSQQHNQQGFEHSPPSSAGYTPNSTAYGGSASSSAWGYAPHSSLTHQQQHGWGDTAGHQHNNSHHHHDAKASGQGTCSTTGSADLSVHVMVGSDDGSTGSGLSGLLIDQQQHHQLQQPLLANSSSSFRDSRWDSPSNNKRSGGSSSKQGRRRGLVHRLQPVLLLLQLAWRIWPAILALAMSVGSSMLVFPLFTCVDTSGRLGERLPQILFYARLLGDIMGRMVPPAWQLSSSSSVLSAAFLKTKLLVLVPGILNPNLVGGDLCLAALVAGNWFLSGYINTGAYLLAPRLATLEASGVTGSSKGRGLSCCWWPWGFWRRASKGPQPAGLASKGHHHSRHHGSSGVVGGGAGGAGLDALGPAALRSKAGAVMSFCFQTSCFLGLMAAWVVQEVLQESGHPAFTAAAAAGGAAAATAGGGSKLGTADGGGLIAGGAAAATAAAAAGGAIGLAASPDTTGFGYDVLGGAGGSGMPATEAAAVAAGAAADAAGGALGAAAAAIAAAAAVASGHSQAAS